MGTRRPHTFGRPPARLARQNCSSRSYSPRRLRRVAGRWGTAKSICERLLAMPSDVRTSPQCFRVFGLDLGCDRLAEYDGEHVVVDTVIRGERIESP